MLLTIVGPIRRTAILIAPSPAAVLSIRTLAANRTPDRNSRSNWPLACNSSTRQAWRSPARETGRPRGGSTAASKCGILVAVAVRP